MCKVALSVLMWLIVQPREMSAQILALLRSDTLRANRDFEGCYPGFTSACVDRVIINEYKHKYRSTVIDSIYFLGDRKVSEVRFDASWKTFDRLHYSDSIEVHLVYHGFSDLRQVSFYDQTKKEGFSIGFFDGQMENRVLYEFYDTNAIKRKIYYYDYNPPHLAEVKSFLNNQHHGEQIRYHPNGQVEFKGRLVDGYQQGPFYYYNNRGILVTIENYLDGYQDGWQVYFNDDGSFRKQELWREGVCVEGCE